MSEYDKVVKGSLRFLNDSGIKKKKKKQKSNAAKEQLLEVEAQEVAELNEEKHTILDNSHLTKAQREFERRKDKRVIEKALSKADKSHKQRIVELNNYLGSLTENFDIQKVSWTK